LDRSGYIVNGDCYWITLKSGQDEKLLWLILAISNSKFIEKYYDLKFDNKLYSGRRRFMTQYVKKFPLPDPQLAVTQRIILKIRKIYFDNLTSEDNLNSLNRLICQAFSVS
jgi:hypothetical protein